ncbi:hypothetical protein K501DRAFT_301455 [Backusella circina FSU 941]|nr:hypothetical protein K501DRAFT_301455 [Backusella circina FSU 941]
MAVRMFYEPKNPRIITSEDYYISDIEENEEMLDEKPRKRKTGTQALVEFLNNTSPEEFRKDSNINHFKKQFFRRKKTLSNKSNSTSMLPSRPGSPHLLLYRKNYIEILANPFTMTSKKEKKKKSTSEHRKLSTSSYTSSLIQEIESSELPNFRNGPNLLLQLPPKSMLQTTSSGSLPPNSFPITTATTSSTRSPLITNDGTLRRSNSVDKRTKRTSQDLIEEGLLQRLKVYCANDEEEQTDKGKPSELISNTLAQEHIQALSVSLKQQEKIYSNSKKVRHMQVQTMPTSEKVKLEEKEGGKMEPAPGVVRSLELLEQELKQEKIIRQRLEAALEDACDHFEVLSGLAYKKIRELWEDRSRWESACLQVKEQCWNEHQQQILSESGSSK